MNEYENAQMQAEAHQQELEHWQWVLDHDPDYIAWLKSLEVKHDAA